MASNGADFTSLFRRLCDAAASPDGDAGVRSLFTDPSSFDDWAVRWRHRLTGEGGEASERRAAMRAANPAFIPRNHLVEEAISAAVNVGDFQPFEGLLTVLSMRLTRINRPSAATSIRRGPIKSCIKRFAALDQGRASSKPASRQLLRPGELLPHRLPR